MVSTPDAPDPYETANAQGGMNRDTAISQQMLNMVNQQNPWGSVNYNQSGETSYRDSQGNLITIPQFTQTTNYTPEQQAIFNANQSAQTNLANIASEQSGRVQEYLNEPFEFTNRDAEDWAYDLGSQRILPQQQQNQEALRTQLINSGIRPGTAAYNSEMQRLTNANSDQMNQLALTGRSQAYSEALQNRNQPLNEIIGLMSGTQLQNPGSASPGTPQTGVAGVDYTGLVNQQYQAELAQSQSAMGGLFGLGAGLLGMFSDERLKEDIERVGETDDGQPIYTYKYKGDDVTQMGVMAQETSEEARNVDPITGYYRVDYSKVS